VKGIRSLVALSGAMLTISMTAPAAVRAAPPVTATANQGTPAANQARPAANQARPAANQARPAANQAKPAANQATRAVPTKFLRLEEMKVEGRIQKPQAMFLMPRANLNVGELDRSESFLPQVSKALTKPPF
jgi:hypothetical protein